MELNEKEIEYIANLLEHDGKTIHNNIKRVMAYEKDTTELKERFDFVINIIDKLRANSYYFEAVEVCPHCMSENVYPLWDVNEKGFIAVCKHCGKEIFLCDECVHTEDNPHMNCDWCKTECGGKCFRGITKD